MMTAWWGWVLGQAGAGRARRGCAGTFFMPSQDYSFLLLYQCCPKE